MTNNQRPAELGYRWPAEWEPHASTWLAWPHNRATWPGEFERIPPVFAELVRTLSAFESVNILAGGREVMAEAKSSTRDLKNVVLHDIETNDAWTRDHGPTFLVGRPGQPPALIDWRYNAWGGKYPPFDNDDAVPRQIADRLDRHRFTPDLILEGGAIEGNGRGTLLTTTSCLLNANRNPHFDQTAVEQFLAQYLNVTKVLWLDSGEIAGDDTDGHIDQLARFVNETTIVAAWENDSSDENYATLQNNYKQLESMTDQDGCPFQVIPLTMPGPYYCEGHRLPASYLNFYIANGVIVVPQFNDPADKVAVETLADLFPTRKICGLPAEDLVWGLGAFHCLTQQEPMV
jgi:agmatine deiminase